MRHRVAGRKLNRNSSHRKALSRNQILSIFEHDRIRTTLAKAKNVRSLVEKLITIAREDNLANRSQVFKHLPKGKSSARRKLTAGANSLGKRREVVAKRVIERLFKKIAPKYKDRPGGYTRILKLGHRTGDGAEMAQLELV